MENRKREDKRAFPVLPLLPLMALASKVVVQAKLKQMYYQKLQRMNTAGLLAYFSTTKRKSQKRNSQTHTEATSPTPTPTPTITDTGVAVATE